MYFSLRLVEQLRDDAKGSGKSDKMIPSHARILRASRRVQNRLLRQVVLRDTLADVAEEHVHDANRMLARADHLENVPSQHRLRFAFSAHDVSLRIVGTLALQHTVEYEAVESILRPCVRVNDQGERGEHVHELPEADTFLGQARVVLALPRDAERLPRGGERDAESEHAPVSAQLSKLGELHVRRVGPASPAAVRLEERLHSLLSPVGEFGDTDGRLWRTKSSGWRRRRSRRSSRADRPLGDRLLADGRRVSVSDNVFVFRLNERRGGYVVSPSNEVGVKRVGG